jgi:hypothetical protein
LVLNRIFKQDNGVKTTKRSLTKTEATHMAKTARNFLTFILLSVAAPISGFAASQTIAFDAIPNACFVRVNNAGRLQECGQSGHDAERGTLFHYSQSGGERNV